MGIRVRSKYQFVPSDPMLPVICEAGTGGTVIQIHRNSKFVVVKFDNGNCCDCYLPELEILG